MKGYLASVAAPLRGPRRLREDMLAEFGDGFAEAVAEREAAGSSPDRAAAEAAEEFGEPALIAAAFQRELAAAQARRTAWTLLIALPAMTIMWDLFSGDRDPGLAVTLLARLTDLATAAAFTVAALVVARRLERRAASLCGAVALAHLAVALGCSALITVFGPRGEADVAPAVWLLLLGGSAVGSAWVAGSAVLALRVGRAAA
jgi:hypothetical protein